MHLYHQSPAESHSFDADQARLYGVDEAIMINHLAHHIKAKIRMGEKEREGRIWYYQTRAEFAAWFGYWTEKQIKRIMRSLVKQGVIVEGNFNKSPIDTTIWYAFENKKMFTKDQMVTREPKRAQQYQVQTTSSSLLRKEQDLGKDRAFSSKRKTVFKGQEAPFQKRWKLTDEQMAIFNWLKSLNTSTREGTIIWWSKNFTKERLESAYNQAKQGARDSVGGYMKILLEKTNPVVSEHTATNREMAEEFKASQNWTALKIHQDKVSCKIHTGSVEDVMLHLDPIYFMSKLISLKEMC